MGEANFYYFTCLNFHSASRILVPWLKPYDKSLKEITLDRK